MIEAQPRAASSPQLVWTNAAPLPRQLQRPAAAVGRDGNIYVFGGADQAAMHGVSRATYIYHPGNNSWSRRADMPVAREGAQAVALPDGHIVVLGGGANCDIVCHAGSVYNRVDIYNPETDTWATLAPMHSPRYRCVAVFTRGRIYAIGGVDGHEVTNSVEAYDTNHNRWNFVAGLPQPKVAPAGATDRAGNIEVMGGSDGNMASNTLFIYDGHAWHTGPSMPTARADFSAARGSDGRIYAIGGYGYTWLATVEAYDPRSQSWTGAAPLPSPECCMATVTTSKGRLYVIGGNQSASNGDGSMTHVLVGAVPLAPATVNLSDDSLDFGRQHVGVTSASETVTLTHSHSAPLRVDDIFLGGHQPHDFAETNTCAGKVDISASCTIHVTFKPRASGRRSAELFISDNASDSPQVVALTGVGIR